MTGVTLKLGLMIKIALNQEDKMDYDVRRGRMRLLLGAIAYMVRYYKPLICGKTASSFSTLFQMIRDVKAFDIEGDELVAEFNFSWPDYVVWVKEALLCDEFLSKDFATFDELVDGLNNHLVPVFFCEYCNELYEMNAVFFQNADLYYCYYRDGIEEDLFDDEPMDTLRVLNLRGRKEYFSEGDILYTGVCGIIYIERSNSIAITFYKSDWFECYSLDKMEVDVTYRNRFLLGVTKRGEEVLLRDSEDKKRLEVVYVDRKNEKEKYIMDYSCYLQLEDGIFKTNWLYHGEAFMRAYTVELDGEKKVCSEEEWKEAVWSAMLSGIETECVDYYIYGLGVVNNILRVSRSLRPPAVFSIKGIEARMREVTMETKGEEIECELFSYLRGKGIFEGEDLFEFFAEAASYYTNMHWEKWMYSDRFISYLEDTDDLVMRIRTCPESIFEWSRAELAGEVGGRRCSSLSEFLSECDRCCYK